MRYFRNPIVIYDSVICNILYYIMKSFSLIRGPRHGWSNNVKTLCTVYVIVLSLYSWTNIIDIKVWVDIHNLLKTIYFLFKNVLFLIKRELNSV